MPVQAKRITSQKLLTSVIINDILHFIILASSQITMIAYATSRTSLAVMPASVSGLFHDFISVAADHEIKHEASKETPNENHRFFTTFQP